MSHMPYTQEENSKLSSKKTPGCWCGRSPTGKCVGWHAYTQEQFVEKKAQYEQKNWSKESNITSLKMNGEKYD